LKILKHCNDTLPLLSSGQLLGVEYGSEIEITHSFPSLQQEHEEEEAEVKQTPQHHLTLHSPVECRKISNCDVDTIERSQC